jgi:hypothetical protein
MRCLRLVLALPLPLLFACGDETPTPAPAEPVEEKAEPEAAAPKVDVAAADETAATPDEEAGDEWATDDGADEEGAEAGAEPEAATPHPGPCKLTWSTGAVLQFKYTETGGTVKVDEDGDRKSETCGAFTSADGKTTEMKIDEGCDKKNDITISPAYDDKANVATASFKRGSDDKAVTLVTIPGFTGLTPGYPLYAERSAAGVKVSKGLVRSADVKSPWEGPAMKVAFTYDKEGRVTRIKEDHERDGTTDRRFDYRYDAVGNVTRISVVIGSGEAEQKGSARLSYTCHAPAEPAAPPAEPAAATK